MVNTLSISTRPLLMESLSEKHLQDNILLVSLFITDEETETFQSLNVLCFYYHREEFGVN